MPRKHPLRYSLTRKLDKIRVARTAAAPHLPLASEVTDHVIDKLKSVGYHVDLL